MSDLFHRLFPVFTVFFFVLCLFFNLKLYGEEQYVLLARSFLAGHTYFVQLPVQLGDTFYYRQHYYWPNPPLPALMFTPLVWLGSRFHFSVSQGLLQPFLVAALFFVIYMLCRKLLFSTANSLALAFAFCFSTTAIGVLFVPWSWYVAHTLALLFVFLALVEYFGRQRTWFIGLLFGLVLATRFTAALGLIFFLFRFPRSKYLSLTLPSLITFVLLIGYNYVRFGTVVDLGYLYNSVPAMSQTARAIGTFSLSHVPANLYYLLLSPPRVGTPFLAADSLGMGFLFTAPLFLWLMFLRYRHPLSRYLLFTVLVIVVPILCYFSLGYHQFGYRYSLDFLPYLFLLFLLNYSPPLRPRFQAVVLLTSLTNLYLLITFVAQFIRRY